MRRLARETEESRDHDRGPVALLFARKMRKWVFMPKKDKIAKENGLWRREQTREVGVYNALSRIHMIKSPPTARPVL